MRYIISTSVSFSAHVVDGKVSGIDTDGGWSEPYVEVVDDETGDTRPATEDEMYDALEALTGNWSVTMLPSRDKPGFPQ